MEKCGKIVWGVILRELGEEARLHYAHMLLNASGLNHPKRIQKELGIYSGVNQTNTTGLLQANHRKAIRKRSLKSALLSISHF